MHFRVLYMFTHTTHLIKCYRNQQDITPSQNCTFRYFSHDNFQNLYFVAASTLSSYPQDVCVHSPLVKKAFCVVLSRIIDYVLTKRCDQKCQFQAILHIHLPSNFIMENSGNCQTISIQSKQTININQTLIIRKTCP